MQRYKKNRIYTSISYLKNVKTKIEVTIGFEPTMYNDAFAVRCLRPLDHVTKFYPLIKGDKE